MRSHTQTHWQRRKHATLPPRHKQYHNKQMRVLYGANFLFRWATNSADELAFVLRKGEVGHSGQEHTLKENRTVSK